MEQSPEEARTSLLRFLQPLHGLTCDGAEIGLGESLRLRLVPARPERDADAWEVESDASAWRIMKSGSILAGQADCVDWERGIEAPLAALRGRRLVEVALASRFADAAFIFDADLAVEFHANSSQHPAWQARAPGAAWAEVGPGHAWRALVPDAPMEAKAAEQAFIDYAGAFSQRWRGRVAAQASAGKCGRCAHWRNLTGGFHFWDFGVCANPHSGLDGQLVGFKSGCDKFSISIDE